MAIYKPTAWAGEFLKGAQPDELLTNATYVKGKLSRAAILAKRLISGKPIARNRKMVYTNQGSDFSGQEKRNFWIYQNAEGSGVISDRIGVGKREKDLESFNASAHHMRYSIDNQEYQPVLSENARNMLSIMNPIDSRLRDTTNYGQRVKEDKIIFNFLGDGKSEPTLQIPLLFVPRETQFTPGNNLVAIASPGRNTPFYHYTGAEDTLEFTIDWLSEDYKRYDVITMCRTIEAYSKNDGYFHSPKILSIIWGKDDILYNNSLWVIAKAPYKLQNFNRAYKDPNTKQVISTGLLPNQAYQEITLKRISSFNQKWEDIKGYTAPKQKVEPIPTRRAFSV